MVKHEKNGNPKLAQSDVRAIFECMHNNAPPPPHLKFTIVPVGPTGQRFSPPSYEFEDGLYMLLKPMKKPKKKDTEWKAPKQPPEHLRHLIWRELPPENCPWSLSGPQFPNQGGTAIQQRYCYPNGNPDYSMFKGGAIWTMYYEDGKEADEFRLLHVYYSNKRATNKKAKKRRKAAVEAASISTMTPPRSVASTVSNIASPAAASVTLHSPTITNETESTTVLQSPLSALSLHDGVSSCLTEFWPAEQPIVTPLNDILPRSPKAATAGDDDDDVSSLHSQGASYSLPSPFRRPAHTGFGINVRNSPLQRTGEYRSPLPNESDGPLDYVPPPEELRSIMTEPIMSYDDDDDSFATHVRGELQEGIQDHVLATPKREERAITQQDWEEKLEEDPGAAEFDEDSFRQELSMPYFDTL